MTGKIRLDALDPVSETLLIPLFYRAQESRRPNPILKDEKAAEIIDRLDHDFSALKNTVMVQVGTLLRARELDCQVGAFLTAHPDALIVDLGSGLDTRFSRVDTGTVRWRELDFPEVIALRRKFFVETPRCRFIESSILDHAWIDEVEAVGAAHVLFVAEGVFPYLAEGDVRSLCLALMRRFPGAQILFDGIPRFLEWASRLHPALRTTKARVRWGMGTRTSFAAWHDGIVLLDDRCYMAEPDPRLWKPGVMTLIPALRHGFRVVRLRLGEAGMAEAAASPVPVAMQV